VEQTTHRSGEQCWGQGKGRAGSLKEERWSGSLGNFYQFSLTDADYGVNHFYQAAVHDRGHRRGSLQ